MTDHITTFAEIADILDDLPRAVYHVRRSRGLSNREAAKQVGINFSTLRRIEQGDRGYHIDNAIAIMRWLDGVNGHPKETES